MIRKPDAGDFRESGAVTAIRETRTLAVEGAKGVGQGAQSVVKWWLIGTFAFGFLMSVIGSIGPVGLLLVCAAGVVFAVTRVKARGKRAARDRAARWGETAPMPMPVAGEVGVTAPVQVDLSVGAVARSAAKVGVPAILFFPTTGFISFMAPFTLGAIAALALAFLNLARLFGDRAVLRYDAETLIVKGLLGEATILWADVGDVTVRKAAWWDLRVMFTSGTRRNLVVLGRYNRLGGPDTLYIPIDLLGLDAPALGRLVTRLLMLRAGVPAAAATPAIAAPTAPVAAPAAAPIAARTDGVFDPDAIMARYLAERETLIATQRPDLAPAAVAQGRPSFGRKRTLA